ncbi:hypothetical protein RND81_09G100800 [Saponaria officinalis]|uniref:DUF4283 domain-containing protein n=1 Tax=Saponaria officinalis TaxID=3572 RepID=A0AAW1IL04_SAPOF
MVSGNSHDSGSFGTTFSAINATSSVGTLGSRSPITFNEVIQAVFPSTTVVSSIPVPISTTDPGLVGLEMSGLVIENLEKTGTPKGSLVVDPIGVSVEQAVPVTTVGGTGSVETTVDPITDPILIDIELEEEVTKWSNTLMGNVLGAKPTLKQVTDFVHKHWNHGSLPLVQYFRKGWFSFRFANKEDMNAVLRRGPWSMGSHSWILKQWSPTFSSTMECVSVVPIWVLFPDLDPFMWTDTILSKMASKIGTPLFADLPTTLQARLSFARVMVEMDRIVYEWLPYYCKTCKKLGHIMSSCKKNKKKEGAKTNVVQEGVQSSGQSCPDNASGSLVLGGTSVPKVLEPPPLVVDVTSGGLSHQDKGGSFQPSEAVMHSKRRELGHQSGQTDTEFKVVSGRKASKMLLSGLYCPLIALILCVQWRIWLLWHLATTHVTILEEHPQVVHCLLRHHATGRDFHVSVVYGSNSAAERQSLWASLLSFSPVGPWLVLGDFNVIRYDHEKISHIPPVISDHLDFNECLLSCGLDDMSCTGCEFTWHNRQESGSAVYSKLDRVMINTAWSDVFAQTSAQFLTPGLSDHSPSLVTFHDDPLPRKRFSFLNCWVDHPRFCSLVAEAWHGDVNGTPMFRLMGKLRNVKRELKKLHHNHFAGIGEKVHQKKAEKMASSAYWKLKEAECKILWQRAKIHDLKYGDISSQYLFSKIKEMQQAQVIGAIQDHHGNSHTGLQQVGDAFVAYYQHMLGSSSPVTAIDPSVILNGNVVDTSDFDALIRPVTRSEIKLALHAIDSNKSPGVDGFSSGFFKAAWHIIEADFCCAIEDFFKTSFMPKQANATLVSLIPKKQVPQIVKDFRPILCCSVVYKTVSKILISRLQRVMPKLVGKEQAAFIQGRSLFDNVLITQGLVKGYDRQGLTPRCMIKVRGYQ